MQDDSGLRKAEFYLRTLCSVLPNRRTGSAGNRAATDFFARTVAQWDYEIETHPFDCLDFSEGTCSLTSDGHSFPVKVSPFSLGCDVTAERVVVSTVEELEHCECRGKLLLMMESLCAEQLMPKNFVFYNPDHHKQIYSLLESQQPAAIITATEKKPELVGALYPFPLIEDGDFDIPSVYCTAEVGREIAAHRNSVFSLKSDARRIPSTAGNVIARNNPGACEKIIICAHIDAYGNAPGASDNASGTVVELLLAEMLADYSGNVGIEIIAFNGEDYYSVGGQMDYLRRYGNDLSTTVVAINIDDVGYVRGKTAYSLYECPPEIQKRARAAFRDLSGMMEGEPWYQGDHMIFVQNRIPAIAITSEYIAELMANYTHSEKDVPEIVDCRKLLEVAHALKRFILSF
ncbi:Zn-dependent exopeptidase M28 [bacterium]|nr:Zn-dependent exopeptidase M28 [bacterium]MBU1984600.1 Zn-dependent exopeptidase M28 [bacterium]